VWQTTRPYRCNICLFGFGRDKTRAIHVKERKKGCKAPPPGSSLLREVYENSPEALRDRRIDAARSTEEIVQILDDYDREKGPNASPPREAEYSEDEEGSEVGKPNRHPLCLIHADLDQILRAKHRETTTETVNGLNKYNFTTSNSNNSNLNKFTDVISARAQ
jgi:hypothetical protein